MDSTIQTWKTVYQKRGAMLLALLALLVMLLTLFAGGMIGLSNNGDYYRVMGAQNLEWLEADRAFLFEPDYAIVPAGETPQEQTADMVFSTERLDAYPSIHQLFVRVAVVCSYAIGAIGGTERVFSLAYLGVLYSVLYALLLWGLFASFRLRRVLADLFVKLAMIFVLCDVGYIAYFNSFYSEPVQILALLSMAVTLLRLSGGQKPVKWFGLFCLSAVGFGWSKFANLPLAVIAIVFVGIPLFCAARPGQKLKLAGIAAGGLAVLCAVLCILPAWMSWQTDYNAVFYGALKDEDGAAVSAYASELGLEDYISLAGTHSYISRVAGVRDAEPFRSRFQTGKLQVAGFYLRHPGYFWKKLTISVNSAGYIRPYYLGNHGDEAPRLTLSNRFSLWSQLRQRTGFDGWLLNFLVFAVAVLLVFGVCRRRGTGRMFPVCVSLMLAGLLAYALASPVVCNGEADLAKHMFSFVQIIDGLVLFDLAAAAYLVTDRAVRWRSVAAFAVLGCVLAWPLGELGIAYWQAQRTHSAPEPDSYVVLGERGGQAMIWRVTEAKNGVYTLLADTPVEAAPFSADNRNLWSESSLRAYLNGPFLEVFTEEERGMLAPTRNRFVLAEENEALAEDGDRDFYAFHTPRQAARGEEEAFGAYVEDTVFLPDLTTVCGVMNRGGKLPACWVETPYCPNGQMLRVVTWDGALSMRDAKDPYHVLPCITVTGEVSAGTGSRSDPFVLR